MYEWKRYETKIVRGDMATGESLQVGDPESCLQLFQQHAKDSEQESFWVIAVDHNNHCLGIQELYKGTVSGAAIRIAEILRLAVITQASGLIAVHNHPSGNAEESGFDANLTENLHKACELMDVDLLDHLIVTGSIVTSLRKKLLNAENPIWYNATEEAARKVEEMFA